MLGSMSNPSLSAKAKETHGILEFAVQVLERYEPAIVALGGDIAVRASMLLTAGRYAVVFDDLVQSLPRSISRSQQQSLLVSFLSHCSFLKRAGADLKPKHHIMLHCIQRCGHLGSPKWYHTYRDESLNGIIGTIAAASHRTTFSSSVFSKFGVMQQLGLRQAVT